MCAVPKTNKLSSFTAHPYRLHAHTHRRTYGIHNTKRANVHKYQSGRKPSSLSACIPHNLYQHKIIWFCCFRRQSFTGIRCVHSETFTVRFDNLHAKFRILPGTKRVCAFDSFYSVWISKRFWSKRVKRIFVYSLRKFPFKVILSMENERKSSIKFWHKVNK